MGTIPTLRQRNGRIAYGTIIMLLIFMGLMEMTHEVINIFLSSLSYIEWQIDIILLRKYIFTLISSILSVLLIGWSYRNKLHKGLKQALVRWYLIKKIRKGIYHAKYDTTLTHNNTKYALLPRVKVEFDDDKLQSGQVWIRSSTRDNNRLSKVDITPDLKGYKVEQSYIDRKGDWYIYDIYSVSSEIQQSFDTLEEFVQWSQEGVDDYQLKIDNRFTTDLTHTEIVGATRSGKTYGMLSLLIQMVNKDIDYELYFADPKNADFKNYGFYINKNRVAVHPLEICDLIDQVYRRMQARQDSMNDKLKENAAADYRNLGLEPIILLFDEYPSWFDQMSDSKSKDVKEKLLKAESQIKQISQMGAGSGVFLILVFQKLDAKTLSKSIQSNMLLKIVLGNADNQTYLTAIDRVEDVPNYNFGKGQGVYKNETMTKPRLLGLSNLKFIEEYNKNPDLSPKDMFKKINKNLTYENERISGSHVNKKN